MTRQPPVTKNNKTIITFAYDKDLEQIYAFYCSRYKDISFKDFMQLGMIETQMKLNSIPESEPLYIIIKSRTINIGAIKDKEERKYWRELRHINKIPDIYISTDEIYDNLKSQVKNVNKVNQMR